MVTNADDKALYANLGHQWLEVAEHHLYPSFD
jgi:hypothetical protein